MLDQDPLGFSNRLLKRDFAQQYTNSRREGENASRLRRTWSPL